MSQNVRQLWLIRHPPVASQFKGVCYGSDDVPLEPGYDEVVDVSMETVASWNVDVIWTSDLQRAYQLGSRLAGRLDLTHQESSLLRERFYGNWQGIAWNQIPEKELEAAHEMLHDPESFRPGGGETTNEVVERGMQWLDRFFATPQKRAAVVSHSGLITALVGTLLGLKPIDWNEHYLKPLEGFAVELSGKSIQGLSRFSLP